MTDQSKRKYLAFMLDQRVFALPLPSVERIVRSVEITDVPGTPGDIQGLVNLKGRIIPVINVRRRYRCPEKGIGLKDKLVIARSGARFLAFSVTEIRGIFEVDEQDILPPGELESGMEFIEGAIRTEDGIVLVIGLTGSRISAGGESGKGGQYEI